MEVTGPSMYESTYEEWKAMSEQTTTIFACKNIGIAGTTPTHVKDNGDGTFTARRGFALFGSTQMSEQEFEACGHNPFHPDFFDNYSEGAGPTPEKAIENMRIDAAATAESLWA